MYYYAYIDDTNTVTGTYALPSAITADGYIAITEQQHNDSQAGNENSLIGKVYNAETGLFEDPIPWSGSSDQVQYKDTTKSVSTKLDEIEADIAALGTGTAVDAYTKAETDTLLANKANATDLHTHDNKTVLDGITADKVAAWDAGTAGTDGEDGVTFTPSVSTDGVISWTNNGGLENPAAVNIKGADGANGTDGVTPHIGSNGNWYIGTTDTGVKAQGTDGEDGADGADGSTKIHFGNYTGDGNTVQTISLGYNAQGVILFPSDGAVYKDGYHYGGLSYTNGICSANNQAVFMASGSTLYVYNAGTSRANVSGQMYYYMAIEA